MKGIVLAGGSGSRLHPVTLAVSKQLMPIYDKPMIYYPLSVLMLAGVRDILVISTPVDLLLFQRLLGDGSRLGIRLSYAEQARPNGLAEAFLIGADHIGNDSVALILGDNVFHGPGFSSLLRAQAGDVKGAVLFGYRVADPHRYGVGEADDTGELISIEEKPSRPRSDRAITGLYFYDNDVIGIARELKPSPRGELEITDVNNVYLKRGLARMVELGRGFAWLDTGTHESLLAAGQFVRTLEERQGLRVACLEEIALNEGYIDAEECHRLGAELGKSPYGRYLMAIAEGAARSTASGAGPDDLVP
ncbi:glucose-1-phosphate thymidylyltransferase RfbA [Amycolatopsis sp. cmx-4-83]|uniref:glucose-1-phosphate thymidylyltransferase RfbA n=1 Tax=Amycolatopsis sp. cmx-4-83 TaxID=2790940 RepID=UPI00397A975D